jgi:hypothetical protein
MQAIPARIVLGTLAAAAGFAILWYFAKVPVFRRLRVG